MKQDILVKVISKIAYKLPFNRYIWALTGGASMQFRGISHNANDIDILASPQFTKAASKTFSSEVILPPRRNRKENIESFYSFFIINGIPIDIMADVINLGPDLIWRPHYEWINNINEYQVGNITIPLLSLEYEIEISKKLGLEDRIKKILEFQSKEYNPV